MAIGMVGFAVSRVWGTADAVVGARRHNRRLREVSLRFTPPATGGRGVVGGLGLTF